MARIYLSPGENNSIGAAELSSSDHHHGPHGKRQEGIDDRPRSIDRHPCFGHHLGVRPARTKDAAQG